MVKNDLAHGKRPFAKIPTGDEDNREIILRTSARYVRSATRTEKVVADGKKTVSPGKVSCAASRMGISNPPVAAPRSDGYTRGIILRRIRHRKQRGRNNRRTVQRYCNWD